MAAERTAHDERLRNERQAFEDDCTRRRTALADREAEIRRLLACARTAANAAAKAKADWPRLIGQRKRSSRRKHPCLKFQFRKIGDHSIAGRAVIDLLERQRASLKAWRNSRFGTLRMVSRSYRQPHGGIGRGNTAIPRDEDYKIVRLRDDLVSAVRYALMMRRSGKLPDECESYGRAPGAMDGSQFDPRRPRHERREAKYASGLDFDLFTSR